MAGLISLVAANDRVVDYPILLVMFRMLFLRQDKAANKELDLDIELNPWYTTIAINGAGTCCCVYAWMLQ